MNFKFVVLFASVAAISCAQFDSREQEQMFDNHGHVQQQNDQRRFHEQERFEDNRQFHHQDRFDNERRFQDRFDANRRHQDRFDDNNRRNFNHQDRFDERNNFNNRGHFDQNQQNPTFLHLQPAVFNLQSSSRHFNVQDDSNYDVAYSVSDVTTGDIKTHQETRRGDEVQGQYTILDSDGFQRKVNYRANDRDGFDADVKREKIVGFGYTNNYQGHHNQHHLNNQNNNFNNQQFGNDFHQQQQQVQFLAQPVKSVATTSVSKTEDGQHNQYTTTTTTN